MPAPGSKFSFSNLTKLTIILVCVAHALWAALWFWAALLTVRAEKLISLWEQQPDDFNKELAAQLIPRIERSLLLNPMDANTHLMLAKLYEQLGIDNFAEEQYQLALARQPTWDYAWARLAKFYSDVKIARDKDTEELAIKALAQAMDLGPYELATQQVVIPLIFKYWQQIALAPHLELKANEILSHALQYNENASLALDTAQYYRNLDILEPLIKKEWQRNILGQYKEELRMGGKKTND